MYVWAVEFNPEKIRRAGCFSKEIREMRFIWVKEDWDASWFADFVKQGVYQFSTMERH